MRMLTNLVVEVDVYFHRNLFIPTNNEGDVAGKNVGEMYLCICVYMSHSRMRRRKKLK